MIDNVIGFLVLALATFVGWFVFGRKKKQASMYVPKQKRTGISRNPHQEIWTDAWGQANPHDSGKWHRSQR